MSMELTIEAGKTERQYWKDLWNYKELFLILTWRDIVVQYKQTVVGILWAVLRPLLTMLAFTFVFGSVAKLPSEGNVPYALMVYSAMLPWQLFSTALSSASNALVVNANLVSKVYFPRLLVPTATVGVAIVDFLLSMAILGVIMCIYRYLPPIQFFAVIPLALLGSVLALGPGLLLCSLNVTYRDFRYIIPFITQFGLYVSPVGFSSSVVPEKWQALFMCNPMVGVIDGFRWALLGTVEFPVKPLLISVVFATALLVTGVKVFRKTEKTFADVI
ncbi:phosphate ABC transporter permease [Halodesulfovibrio spirochaetisodalis]|uniref:Transport permease protein n=2 Tax=Halodesulfovibrio spirochaetisodalis TaxID=1560234 RepID=A0A1B7XI33_9BACT|nr:phosphate ABC transporter permease [Halodesulfovibrio spirochaetisodalis]